jgi:hypothetical protein
MFRYSLRNFGGIPRDNFVGSWNVSACIPRDAVAAIGMFAQDSRAPNVVESWRADSLLNGLVENG